MRDVLDRQLGKITMYRLVTIVLGLLAVLMLAYTAAGAFDVPFTVKGELVTLVVLLVASYASNRVLGLLWRITPHAESSIITALLLFFMFWPSTKADDLAWLAITAALANASKYVLAWRGRHIFNPAAAGTVLSIIVQDIVGRDLPINATWWIATDKMLPFVAVGALIVLWRTRRLDVGLLFVIFAYVFAVWGLTQGFGAELPDALRTVAYSFPIVFMAGFMVSEPLTLPPRRPQQLAVAGVMALAFSSGSFLSIFDQKAPSIGVISLSLPEVALLIGNLVAFGFARRHGVAFVLEQRRQLTPETHELTFRPTRPMSFVPGQYAELTLPHSKADTRGARRSFSISSAPGDSVSFMLRVPEKSSSFKKALLALEPGDTVHSTGVGGDFVWPRDPSTPLLLVAGGIGITPFLSQLRHDEARDAVLVYGASSAAEVPFVEELEGVRVVLVCPGRPDHLPSGWTYVEAPYLSAELVAQVVPDLAERRAYVSGPPAMINAVRTGLAQRCKSVKTDYFSGY